MRSEQIRQAIKARTCTASDRRAKRRLRDDRLTVYRLIVAQTRARTFFAGNESVKTAFAYSVPVRHFGLTAKP